MVLYIWGFLFRRMALTRMQMDPLFEQSCFVWKFFASAVSTCLAAGQVFKNTPYLAVKIFTEVPLKFSFKLVKIIRHFIRSVEWFQNLPWYFSVRTVKLLGFRHLENISDLVYWKTYPAVRNIHKIQTHDTHKKFERTFQGKFCKNLWLTYYFPWVLITTQRTW